MVANATIWQAVCGELEVTTSKAHFKTWIPTSELVSLTDTVAVVSVANIFIRSWVETNYKARLLDLFQKHVPTITEVQLQIDGIPVMQSTEDDDEIDASQRDQPAFPSLESNVTHADSYSG